KGGSAFIPIVNGGDFPLRPLHPRKLKTIPGYRVPFQVAQPLRHLKQSNILHTGLFNVFAHISANGKILPGYFWHADILERT
ncbi:MAG: hypothetical protein PWQ69_1235, partial [Methanomicrobiaceae archaeon]|nr:hypothetical protein [Methanomicrobiaceae archaeon]